MIIRKIIAKKIYNSRKEETIKVFVKSDICASEASSPSGASVGKHEVSAFPKEGINFAVNLVNKEVNDKLVNFEFKEFKELEKVEEILKEYNIKGNTLLALELALLKNLGPLWKVLNKNAKQVPRPLGNVIGGGKHIKGRNALDIQEFLLLSLTAKSFSDAVNANLRAHTLIRKQLRKIDNKFNYEMTDEGAWAPNISNFAALDLLKKVVNKVSEEVGFKLRFGLDVASSSFFDGKNYVYKNYSDKEKEKKLNASEQLEFIGSLIEKYNLLYVEDPFNEEDFKSFAKLNKKYGKKCMVVGDDLTTTNLERVKKAVKEKAINAIILKPNQIGSLVEFDKVVKFAQEKKLHCIISHRSGETLDISISHLAVGYNIPIIKCGIYGKEREVKLQEIRKTEREIKFSKSL